MEINDKFVDKLIALGIINTESYNVREHNIGQSDYSKRIIGFFAERMMTVWVIKNRLKVKELPYFTID